MVYECLPARQRKFFVDAVTLSYWLASQIQNKLKFFYDIDVEISNVIILAEILYKSEFGDHPLAQPVYPAKGTKAANNLTILPIDSSWTGKKLKWEGKEYKAFEDFSEYGTHFSDIIVFRHNFKDYLISSKPPMDYNRIIETYRLEDFAVGKSER